MVKSKMSFIWLVNKPFFLFINSPNDLTYIQVINLTVLT